MEDDDGMQLGNETENFNGILEFDVIVIRVGWKRKQSAIKRVVGHEGEKRYKQFSDYIQLGDERNRSKKSNESEMGKEQTVE